MGTRNRPPPTPAAARKAAAADVCCALGEVLAHQRETAGFTQADLAAVVGVTQHMVSYWESGKAQIGAHHLLLVAARLRVPPATLLADGWADASPCARMVVPRPAGDQPAELRWRRPPHRPRPPVPPDALTAGLEGRLRAAGLTAEQAATAAWDAEEEYRCGVGWQRADCGRRPVFVGVRPSDTRRWGKTPPRLVVRKLCSVHARALDRRWIVVPLG